MMHTLITEVRQKANGKGMSNLSFITLAMFGVLVAVFGVASLLVPRFFDINNVSNLIAQQADIIIIGIGVTFLMISGYFDLSVGGIIAMAAVLSAYFSQAPSAASFELGSGLGIPYGLALVLTLICCVGIGAINAFFIVKMKIASVIVTLGTLAFSRGIAMIVAQGAQRNTGLPPIFKECGSFTFVGTLNLAVLIMIVLLIGALIVEKKTVFGRRMYQIGANQTAARLSGVKVDRELSLLYILSALLGGISGIVMASKFNSGNCALGTGYEFDALVVTVLGGTSVFGGFGSVAGMVIGAFILGILSTSVNMLGFPPSLQMLVRALVIIVAILAQRFALDRRNV
jgi:ribose/xylose/arabinose/galactoside ABC-type transport system permease subunit